MNERKLTQTLTAVWIATCREHGGQPPSQDEGGWDEDGDRRPRGQHPIGHQIKTWVEEHLAPTVEELDAFLVDIRTHAAHWAATTRGTA